MVITNFLKMVLRYFTQEDKETSFADWRQELNDNFTKIDEAVETVNTELDKKLEKSNILAGDNIVFTEDEKGDTIISATADVTEETVNEKITEHNISGTAHSDIREKTDIIITTGTGKQYLSDDGTYKEIKGGGTTIFDIDEYESYTAITDTTTFTIELMNESKIVQLVKDNLLMIQGTDYTIDKTTGVVTLNFTLLTGEKIYYKELYGADNVIVYNTEPIGAEAKIVGKLVDINENTITPMTVLKAVEDDNGKKLNIILDEKLNKSDVIDITTQVEAGKALDARQANPSIPNSLRDRIASLTSEKVLADGYDLDNYKTAGKRTFNATALHLPSADITDGSVEYIPYATATNYGQQKVLGFSTSGNQEEYTRLLNNSVWTGWDRKATDKDITALKSLSMTEKLTQATKIADIAESGIYQLFGANTQFSDYPTYLTNLNHIYGTLKVNNYYNAYFTYEIIAFDGNYSNPIFMHGSKNANTGAINWSRTSFTCTALTGYKITYQDCYIENGHTNMLLIVQKSDNSVFGAGQHGLFSSTYYNNICQIPAKVTCIASGAIVQSAPVVNSSLWLDGVCYATFSSLGSTNALSIQINF